MDAREGRRLISLAKEKPKEALDEWPEAKQQALCYHLLDVLRDDGPSMSFSRSEERLPKPTDTSDTTSPAPLRLCLRDLWPVVLRCLGRPPTHMSESSSMATVAVKLLQRDSGFLPALLSTYHRTSSPVIFMALKTLTDEGHIQAFLSMYCAELLKAHPKANARDLGSGPLPFLRVVPSITNAIECQPSLEFPTTVLHHIAQMMLLKDGDGPQPPSSCGEGLSQQLGALHALTLLLRSLCRCLSRVSAAASLSPVEQSHLNAWNSLCPLVPSLIAALVDLMPVLHPLTPQTPQSGPFTLAESDEQPPSPSTAMAAAKKVVPEISLTLTSPVALFVSSLYALHPWPTLEAVRSSPLSTAVREAVTGMLTQWRFHGNLILGYVDVAKDTKKGSAEWDATSPDVRELASFCGDFVKTLDDFFCLRPEAAQESTPSTPVKRDPTPPSPPSSQQPTSCASPLLGLMDWTSWFSPRGGVSPMRTRARATNRRQLRHGATPWLLDTEAMGQSLSMTPPAAVERDRLVERRECPVLFLAESCCAAAPGGFDEHEIRITSDVHEPRPRVQSLPSANPPHVEVAVKSASAPDLSIEPSATASARRDVAERRASAAALALHAPLPPPVSDGRSVNRLQSESAMSAVTAIYRDSSTPPPRPADNENAMEAVCREMSPDGHRNSDKSEWVLELETDNVEAARVDFDSPEWKVTSVVGQEEQGPRRQPTPRRPLPLLTPSFGLPVVSTVPPLTTASTAPLTLHPMPPFSMGLQPSMAPFIQPSPPSPSSPRPPASSPSSDSHLRPPSAGTGREVRRRGVRSGVRTSSQESISSRGSMVEGEDATAAAAGAVGAAEGISDQQPDQQPSVTDFFTMARRAAAQKAATPPTQAAGMSLTGIRASVSSYGSFGSLPLRGAAVAFQPVSPLLRPSSSSQADSSVATRGRVNETRTYQLVDDESRFQSSRSSRRVTLDMISEGPGEGGEGSAQQAGGERYIQWAREIDRNDPPNGGQQGAVLTSELACISTREGVATPDSPTVGGNFMASAGAVGFADAIGTVGKVSGGQGVAASEFAMSHASTRPSMDVPRLPPVPEEADADENPSSLTAMPVETDEAAKNSGPGQRGLMSRIKELEDKCMSLLEERASIHADCRVKIDQEAAKWQGALMESVAAKHRAEERLNVMEEALALAHEKLERRAGETGPPMPAEGPQTNAENDRLRCLVRELKCALEEKDILISKLKADKDKLLRVRVQMSHKMFKTETEKQQTLRDLAYAKQALNFAAKKGREYQEKLKDVIGLVKATTTPELTTCPQQPSALASQKTPRRSVTADSLPSTLKLTDRKTSKTNIHQELIATRPGVDTSHLDSIHLEGHADADAPFFFPAPRLRLSGSVRREDMPQTITQMNGKAASPRDDEAADDETAFQSSAAADADDQGEGDMDNDSHEQDEQGKGPEEAEGKDGPALSPLESRCSSRQNLPNVPPSASKRSRSVCPMPVAITKAATSFLQPTAAASAAVRRSVSCAPVCISSPAASPRTPLCYYVPQTANKVWAKSVHHLPRAVPVCRLASAPCTPRLQVYPRMPLPPAQAGQRSLSAHPALRSVFCLTSPRPPVGHTHRAIPRGLALCVSPRARLVQPVSGVGVGVGGGGGVRAHSPMVQAPGRAVSASEESDRGRWSRHV
ncbi:unnamed protein product [Vitrella brassicaformis CCMP3155]|uniref:Hamartin n=4 Tax=Vitrella brassicaformis TaxID=1169539 RepID=A0A0G4ERZ2_VITBC|nr:unnamed protein product [Vitrella brassicaformis CCMP3155]|eukprot:CEM00672.1 unnamed protein product [Vitrella brassicaformis CCMP3155]